MSTPSTLPAPVYSLCEAVADLSAMLAVSPLLPQDSRESCSLCIEWAQAFELAHAGHVWGETDARDYIEELEKFFVAKYAAWIAGPSDTRRNLLVTETRKHTI